MSPSAATPPGSPRPAANAARRAPPTSNSTRPSTSSGGNRAAGASPTSWLRRWTPRPAAERRSSRRRPRPRAARGTAPETDTGRGAADGLGNHRRLGNSARTAARSHVPVALMTAVDRQPVPLLIAAQVGDDMPGRREPLGPRGHRPARQRRVLRPREQPQRRPAVVPRTTRRRFRVENHVFAVRLEPVAAQLVPGGRTRLPADNHEHPNRPRRRAPPATRSRSCVPGARPRG
jgi:hypothetical protein